MLDHLPMAGGASKPSYHKVFTYNHIHRLSQSAPVWCVIQQFDHTQEPLQRMISSAALIELYERRQLCPATLVVGLHVKNGRQQERVVLPLPAPFFRPLELLLELLDANLPYHPITSEDLDRQVPLLDWCLPMQLLVITSPSSLGPSNASSRRPSREVGDVASSDDQEQSGHAQQQRSGASQLEATGATHGSQAAKTLPELLKSAPYWCFVHYYTGGDIKCVMNDPPSTLLQRLAAARLSDYTPMIPLAEKKDFHIFIRGCLFMPLGALMYLARAGAPVPPATNHQLTAFDQRGLRAALAAAAGGGSGSVTPRQASGVWGGADGPGPARGGRQEGGVSGGSAAGSVAGTPSRPGSGHGLPPHSPRSSFYSMVDESVLGPAGQSGAYASATPKGHGQADNSMFASPASYGVAGPSGSSSSRSAGSTPAGWRSNGTGVYHSQGSSGAGGAAAGAAGSSRTTWQAWRPGNGAGQSGSSTPPPGGASRQANTLGGMYSPGAGAYGGGGLMLSPWGEGFLHHAAAGDSPEYHQAAGQYAAWQSDAGLPWVHSGSMLHTPSGGLPGEGLFMGFGASPGPPGLPPPGPSSRQDSFSSYGRGPPPPPPPAGAPPGARQRNSRSSSGASLQRLQLASRAGLGRADDSSTGGGTDAGAADGPPAAGTGAPGGGAGRALGAPHHDAAPGGFAAATAAAGRSLGGALDAAATEGAGMRQDQEASGGDALAADPQRHWPADSTLNATAVGERDPGLMKPRGGPQALLLQPEAGKQPAAAAALQQQGAGAEAGAAQAPSPGSGFGSGSGSVSWTLLGRASSGAQHWSTPLFRLLTGDSVAGAFELRWWYIDLQAGAVQGPHTCEQMLIAYLLGVVCDGTLVCGTERGVLPPLVPPRAWFEGMGRLLLGVGQGLRYRLLSRDECSEEAPKTRLEASTIGSGATRDEVVAADAAAAGAAAATWRVVRPQGPASGDALVVPAVATAGQQRGSGPLRRAPGPGAGAGTSAGAGMGAASGSASASLPGAVAGHGLQLLLGQNLSKDIGIDALPDTLGIGDQDGA